ncbi:MAG: chromate transporter [Lachnospiraceae bacterium]|jgi:chromate transporter|nr:chromate transporter [Lachnospiraceae bacterium]MBQ9342340.1 chromate transporter [Lachnospiraceae bacterium]MBQ9579953.1 chromate transporter [Lachnospiraceae bacterium]
MKELLDLYVSFFKIGILTFGGGMAMLPMLNSELVEKRKWVTEEEILDYFAIGQCTPGIIAVNTATFVGYKKRKALGGLMTTLGVISPSIIIITIVAAFLGNISDNVYVQKALWGIRVAACALILEGILKIGKKGIKDAFGVIIFLLALLSVLFLGAKSVIIVISSIIIGIVYNIIRAKGVVK